MSQIFLYEVSENKKGKQGIDIKQLHGEVFESREKRGETEEQLHRGSAVGKREMGKSGNIERRKIMNIHWITVQVDNMEESKKFYEGYLGLKLKRAFEPDETTSIVFYEAENGMQIELLESKDRQETAKGNGSVSVGISYKDYDSLLDEARERNILIAEPRDTGEIEFFFVRDPDGVPIQIIKE